jgi:hypothetical protein
LHVCKLTEGMSPIERVIVLLAACASKRESRLRAFFLQYVPRGATK